MFHAKKIILNQIMMLSFLVSVGFAALLYGASPTMAADAPDLGTAGTFGVLSSTYTNTVAGTTINGDLGYTTDPDVMPTVNGTTHVADGTYDQAGLDQAAALADLNSQLATGTWLGSGAVNLDTVDIGNGPGVFTPGVYYNDGAMNITVGQTVTLNGPGVYIFRPGGALTTEANTLFDLVGACESDIYWAPVGATTIGANTAFVGTIIDAAGITIGNSASLTGRALAFGGTVTTDTNTITVPDPCEVTLELLKTVDNTGGGTAVAGNFTLTATGPTVVTGTTTVTGSNVPVGVYTITETGPTDYTPAFSIVGGGTLDGNVLTVTGDDAGATITVTITNTYAPGSAVQLILEKTVSGGIALPTDFTLTATGDATTGPMVVSGTTPVGPVNVPVGIYTITETGPAGYTAGFSVVGGGTLDGNVLTITGDDAGATITVTVENIFPPVTPIPTLSEWGMIIFIMIMGLTSVYYLRKRKMEF